MRLVHLHAERAPDSFRVLRDAFSKADCRGCGICCKRQSDFHVPVLHEDPNHQRIAEAARERFPDKVEPTASGFNIRPSGDCCGFLEEAGGSYSCSIYDARPVICREFPFLPEDIGLHDEAGGDAGERLMVLTSSCPKVREAKDRGVAYVTAEDLVAVVKHKGRERYLLHIDILSSAFVKLMDRLSGMQTPEVRCFSVIDDMLAFLVR